MKVNLIVSQSVKVSPRSVERLFVKRGIRIARSGYDYTVIIGGDGTFFDNAIRCRAKPILFVRKTGDVINGASIKHGLTASVNFDQIGSALTKIGNGAFRLVKEPILELAYNGRKYYSAGDFFVERGLVKQALRYHALIIDGGERIDTYAISNGFIVTTPIGSTGYYSYVDILNARKPRGISNGLGFAHILPTKVVDTINSEATKYEIRRNVGPDAKITVNFERGAEQYLYGISGVKEGMRIRVGTPLAFRMGDEKLSVLRPL
jgi:hypothetical protein